MTVKQEIAREAIDTAHIEGEGCPELVVLDAEMPCACGKVTMFYVNRNGRTACWLCDFLAERERLQVN